MIDLIFDGITAKLLAAFGGTAVVCREEAEQGLSLPCFFLLPGECSEKPGIGGSVLLRFPFEVRYLPAGPDKNSEMDSAAAALAASLELIPCGARQLRGTGMRWEKKDGALRFRVVFSACALRDENAETMGVREKTIVTLKKESDSKG